MFSDTDHLSDEAKQAIAWCVETGQLRGVGGGKFAPDAPLTRWQQAIIIHRAANWVALLVERYRQATVTTFNPNTLKTGAGVFVNQEGTIITNKHVILRNDNTVAPWTQYIRAWWGPIHSDWTEEAPRIIYDLNDPTDLAAIQLRPVHRARLPEVLPIVPLDAKGPQEGEPCVAIGSPLAYGNWISSGIVALYPTTVSAQPHVFVGTTAGINPGNSGGPLLAQDGRVLGICALKPWYNSGGWGMTHGDDMGFAIPADVVRAWCERRGVSVASND